MTDQILYKVKCGRLPTLLSYLFKRTKHLRLDFTAPRADVCLPKSDDPQLVLIEEGHLES